MLTTLQLISSSIPSLISGLGSSIISSHSARNNSKPVGGIAGMLLSTVLGIAVHSLPREILGEVGVLSGISFPERQFCANRRRTSRTNRCGNQIWQPYPQCDAGDRLIQCVRHRTFRRNMRVYPRVNRERKVDQGRTKFQAYHSVGLFQAQVHCQSALASGSQ